MKSKEEIIRWVPISGAPELPLSTFSLNLLAGDDRVVVEAYFVDMASLYPRLKPPHSGIVLEFETVHAFKAYEEWSDPFDGKDVDFPALKTPFPYGGCWGFLEIRNSLWIESIADRDGTWKPGDFNHWVVWTYNKSLHVACRNAQPPVFKGWVERN